MDNHRNNGGDPATTEATPPQRGVTIAKQEQKPTMESLSQIATILINTTAVHTELRTNINNTIAVMKTTFYRLKRFYRNTPFYLCTDSNSLAHCMPRKFYAPYDTPQQQVDPRDNGLMSRRHGKLEEQLSLLKPRCIFAKLAHSDVISYTQSTS